MYPCKLNHRPSCWRDNLWPGPLPAKVARNADAVKSIEQDRTANAARLGEAVVALKQPVEDVNFMEEDISDGDEQFESVCTMIEDSDDEQLLSIHEDMPVTPPPSRPQLLLHRQSPSSPVPLGVVVAPSPRAALDRVALGLGGAAPAGGHGIVAGGGTENISFIL